MGYAIPAFPTVLSRKFATLLTDVNGNGYADSGDTIEYFVDVVNVGFATANNVTFQDDEECFDPVTKVTFQGCSISQSPSTQSAWLVFVTGLVITWRARRRGVRASR